MLELRGPDGRGVSCPLPAFRSFALVEDPTRSATVYAFDEEQLVRLSADPGLPSLTSLLPFPTTVRDLHFDHAGRMWIATTTGLWRLSPGDTVRFTKRDGLPTDHVRQIHEDRDGTLWLGTYGGGLVRCRDGHFATLGRRNGLLEEVVSVVLEDDYDNLWLGGNRGIQRLSRLQANECLDGRRESVDVVRYAAESGLRNPEGSGWPGLRTRDGRLWFPTFDGLAVVDPHFAKTLTGTPPAPRVEGVLAGDQSVPRSVRGFVLAPDQRRLTVRYTGIDLSAPEQVHFRYRLDGVDRDWIDARGRTATYTNVPPGRHLFHLVAIGGGGVTSPSSETVAIFVRPSRSNASTGTLPPVRKRRRIGCKLSSGTLNTRAIGSSWAITTRPPVSDALTTLPGSTSRRPTRPVIGEVIRQYVSWSLIASICPVFILMDASAWLTIISCVSSCCRAIISCCASRR